MKKRNRFQVRIFAISLLTVTGLVAPGAHSLAAETTSAAPTAVSAPAAPTGDGPDFSAGDDDEDETGNGAGNDDGSDDGNGAGTTDERPTGQEDDNPNSRADDGEDDEVGAPVTIGGNDRPNTPYQTHPAANKQTEAQKKAATKAAEKAKKAKKKGLKKGNKHAAKKAAKKAAQKAKKAAAARARAQAKAQAKTRAAAQQAARTQQRRSATADGEPDRGGDGRAQQDSGDNSGEDFRDQILSLVNKARDKAGCNSLRASSQLQRSAQGKAEDMSKKRYMDHTSPNGKDFDDNIRAAGFDGNRTGENLGEGFQTASAVFGAWIRSESHRRNILDCKFKVLGVGFASKGGYWVQHFGG